MAVLLAFASGTGCTSDTDFECANNSQCVDAEIQGVCQPNSYCSFPDPACPSMQRYSKLAPSGFAQECVPAGEATEPDSNTTVDMSMSGMASDPASSFPASASSETFGTGGMTDPSSVVVGGPETDVGPGTTDNTTLSTSTDPTMSTGTGGGTSADGGTETGSNTGMGVYGCAESEHLNLGDRRLQSLKAQSNDFDPSCVAHDGRDIAYRWTAPAFGTYRFESGDAAIAIYDDCEGGEIVCDDRIGPPVGGTVLYQLSAGESVLVVVDASDGAGEAALRISAAAD